MSQIKYIDGHSLSYLAVTIANALSEQFDLDDLNILSNIFNAIGDSIGIIASQQQALQSALESANQQGGNNTR